MSKSSGKSGKWRWVKWIFILPILLFLVVQLYFFLQIWWWVDHNPGSTSFMRQQSDLLQFEGWITTVFQTI